MVNLLLSKQSDIVFLLQGNKFLGYTTNLWCKLGFFDGEVTSNENWPSCTDAIKGRVIVHTKLVHIECIVFVRGVNRCPALKCKNVQPLVTTFNRLRLSLTH